ncbi:hypothetical protein DKM44_09640 [Deinococcus irradiatisoli]|uniref:Uncharacterized protein n=1 Tax=Deinococcus irradiatisoli TaxID=2202254 RepID=A0A2Z3JHD5_9DEIO|nr:hypothetical protein [Deinococcus irradiatisoli]AWN23456.1 hypothetical protein DKM44_09640 [Deinococcus irradiatisoli]
MDLLRAFHDFTFNTSLAKLFPNPFTLACFLLLVWSVAPAFSGRLGRSFVVLTRLSWAVFGLYGLSGVLLALAGHKVASAVVAAGSSVTKYGFAPDPKRNLEHWMYTVFALSSLYFIEVLIAGKLIERRKGLYFLPLVTLFLWGCAYMIGRVAVFPGES